MYDCDYILMCWFFSLKYTEHHATLRFLHRVTLSTLVNRSYFVIFSHFSFDLFTFNKMINVLRRGLRFRKKKCLLFAHNITMFSYNGYAHSILYVSTAKHSYYDLFSMYHHACRIHVHTCEYGIQVPHTHKRL